MTKTETNAELVEIPAIYRERLAKAPRDSHTIMLIVAYQNASKREHEGKHF